MRADGVVTGLRSVACLPGGIQGVFLTRSHPRQRGWGQGFALIGSSPGYRCLLWFWRILFYHPRVREDDKIFQANSKHERPLNDLIDHIARKAQEGKDSGPRTRTTLA